MSEIPKFATPFPHRAEIIFILLIEKTLIINVIGQYINEWNKREMLSYR